MGRLRTWLYLLPELFRTLCQRPSTAEYPFGPLEIPAGYRGRVTIVDPEACRGCGLCVRDCPAFALELERESKKSYRLIYHPDRCAYCGQCELSCHFGAIEITNRFVHATQTREGLAEILVDHTEEKSDER